VSRVAASLAGARYGALTVLHEVVLQADSGEILVILGSNGAGKTTALRAAMGMVACARRTLTLDGTDMSALPPWLLPRMGMVLVPDGARCFPNLTVQDNLRGAFIATQGRRPPERQAELLERLVALFPIIGERRTAVAGTLSGGERQMLAVGRALMTEPRVMLLDEPSAGLAPKVVEDLFLALARIKEEDRCAIIMAEQNVGWATRIADAGLVLTEGRVVLAGPIGELVTRGELRTAYLGL
jgi:branched-chain amino acid transport system ATP-binding protein